MIENLIKKKFLFLPLVYLFHLVKIKEVHNIMLPHHDLCLPI